MLEKTYQPAAIEAKFYSLWEQGGYFKAGKKKGARSYTIMMPPANVTGSLHLGHALTFSLQDILIRYHRMLGENVLWQPGTDHAGIATQIVVEKQLSAKGIKRTDLGRDAFLEKMWAWKEESGGTIIRQLKKLGSSADWDRERFTMDHDFNHAVQKVFVDLYRQGLIYRDKRLVNWDITLQSAISDLEVVQREEKGHLWYIKYPLASDPSQFITVATTRPETFFGDTAVAVHPDDERYQHLVNKEVILPLSGRKIPIISDGFTDPEKGSGAVKITPAHDFNDFEMGNRHQLPQLNILNKDGRLNGEVPDDYQGLTCKDAREKVVQALQELGLLDKVEPIIHSVPYSERSGVVIEPLLTDQWFVDAPTLAGPAIEAVESGKTKFVPSQWSKTYFEWMNNIQPWCISRQIWWGHQVPAWYGPDGTPFVAMTQEEALSEAKRHYGHEVSLTRDEDVLDTWFSSALWPFVTLGWPKDTEDLKRYYPTNVLVTGFDIIFFWVARMMMMGLHFQKEVPFETVYIHALVRDAQGQKMSKSKGNIIDPLALMEEYGTDALRFTLALLSTPGRDIKLSSEKVETSRNFATKLWNATRYLLMNECHWDSTFDPRNCNETLNKWIVVEVRELSKKVSEGLDLYRFNDAAGVLYSFAWKTFCDWYIEFSKPILMGEDLKAKEETRKTLAWVLGQILHMLHPIMPFISEELWDAIGGKGLLIEAEWPVFVGYHFEDSTAFDEISWVIDVISEIRGARAEMNVPPSAFLKAFIYESTSEIEKYVLGQSELIKRLARLKDIQTSGESAPTMTQGALQLVVQTKTIILPLEDVIDLEAEKTRIQKNLSKVEQELVSLKRRLENHEFIAKAPLEIVEELQERLVTMRASHEKMEIALSRLGV
jgi:valyl-tRNA synthetase